ncbi:unnamed protein product, partial [marine sediment metagenome]
SQAITALASISMICYFVAGMLKAFTTEKKGQQSSLGTKGTKSSVITTEVRPAYYVVPGIYSWDFVGLITPISARHAEVYALLLNYRSLNNYNWEYTEVPLWRIDKADEWHRTMAKYLYFSGEEVSQATGSRRFPLSDYAILSTEGEYYAGRKLSLEEEKEAYEGFGYWLKSNIPRCRRIRDEMINTKTYYPPVLAGNYSTLNGAHRIATLWKEFGPDYKVWAWVMKIATEVLKK